MTRLGNLEAARDAAPVVEIPEFKKHDLNAYLYVRIGMSYVYVYVSTRYLINLYDDICTYMYKYAHICIYIRVWDIVASCEIVAPHSWVRMEWHILAGGVRVKWIEMSGFATSDQCVLFIHTGTEWCSSGKHNTDCHSGNVSCTQSRVDGKAMNGGLFTPRGRCPSTAL